MISLAPASDATRAVITGLGLCTSLGHDAGTILASLAHDRAAFAESAALPGTPCCPIEALGDDACAQSLARFRHRRYLSRAGTLAVLAGLRAARDCGMERLPQETALLGAASPTLDFAAEKGLPPGDSADLDALWLLRWLPSTPTSVLAKLLDLHGEGLTLGCACASSLQTLGEAWLRIRSGMASTILVACGDSRLSSGGLAGYAKAHTLAPCPAQTAERPFDRTRQGFVPGEGAAAFVVESLSSAKGRNAHIYAELAGFGASLDGGNLTAPDPSGCHAERAVRTALSRAGLGPGEISFIAAHGTGTPLNDAVEAAMLDRVFTSAGARPIVTAIKSWIGHTSGACGAVETAICLACGEHGILPPLRRLDAPIECGLTFALPSPGRPGPDLPEGPGLVESFGFGGQNAALVLLPWNQTIAA